MEMPKADVVFIGGARWPWRRKSWYQWLGRNATWPSVELQLINGRACVRLRWALPRRLAEHLYPPVEVELNQATVEPISPAGVRISTPDNVGIIFWSRAPGDVLDALLARGAQLGEPDELPL
jgi:hypothetical protein